MIRVARTAATAPDGFAARRAELEEGLRAQRVAVPTLSVSKYWNSVRRRLQSDAQALAELFRRKCAYCESPIEHVSPAHIEHFAPKSLSEYEHRAFDWLNWLYACPRCNHSKGTQYPLCDGEPCLVDPTEDDPAAHLDFVDALIVAVTARGKKTIRVVQLSRDALETMRESWLLQLRSLLLLCLVDRAKRAARRLVIWCMQADAPYSAMSTAYVRHVAPKLADPVRPHRRVNVSDAQGEIRLLIQEHLEILAELL